LALAVAALICSLQRSTNEVILFALAVGEEAVEKDSKSTSMEAGDEVDQDFSVEDEEDWGEEAEEGEPVDSVGQQAVDMERMERVFQLITEECQEEMKNAYTDGGSLSDSCTLQIQNAFNNDVTQQQARTNPPLKEYGPNPTPYIISFLAVCFIGVGVKVFNIQQELSKIPPKKKKPLSRKKALKMKMKEQNRQGTKIN